MSGMGRREFVALLGGAAAVWPLAARAQQASGMRRVGVLMGYAENDPEAKVFFAGFTQRLAELGWVEGRNLRMDVRWAPGSVDRMRTFARELVELQPDVILANSTPVTAALQRETRTIPIVFAVASDPVGSGFAASLARPGGNITGFSIAEPSLPGKWIELLSEITPGLQRAAMMFNPDTAAYVSSYYLPSFETAAQSRKVAPSTARVRSDAEIETVITSLGREPGGGLLVMPDNFMEIHRAQIISLVARNNVPAVYQLQCQRRWLALLWGRLRRCISPRRPICGPRAPWHDALGASRSNADKIHTGNKRQDRQSARARRAANVARARRRGDRVSIKRREFITLLGGAAVAWPTAPVRSSNRASSRSRLMRV
jgi:putative ABC transport system substrate-binding protein